MPLKSFGGVRNPSNKIYSMSIGIPHEQGLFGLNMFIFRQFPYSVLEQGSCQQVNGACNNLVYMHYGVEFTKEVTYTVKPA